MNSIKGILPWNSSCHDVKVIIPGSWILLSDHVNNDYYLSHHQPCFIFQIFIKNLSDYKIRSVFFCHKPFKVCQGCDQCHQRSTIHHVTFIHLSRHKRKANHLLIQYNMNNKESASNQTPDLCTAMYFNTKYRRFVMSRWLPW